MSRVLVVSIVVLATLASPVLPAQEFQPPTSSYRPAGEAFPFGAALQGVRIAISPGHGWLIEDGSFQRSRWKWTLCGSCEGLVEDLLTSEICQDHLVPLLRQAGAQVFVPRELDRQESEVVVDDGDPGYAEVGPWQAGTLAGLGYAGDYRALPASGGGEAFWTLQVPSEGDYWVQVRHAAGTNRCPDTRFRVEHAGGATDFVVDQRDDGSAWIYLGRFRFGKGPATVAVQPPPSGNCYAIADAVRIGGGVDRDTGLPRWQMAALHWLSFDGMPGTSAYNDVTVRPAWANAIGAGVYVSLHANAGGDQTSSGTSTYRHNCGTGVRWDTLDPALCDQPAGSADLQAAIQARIVRDVRAEWEPGWHDGGNLVANFGELRSLDGIPGALIESAFFDGVLPGAGNQYSDNRSLHDPRFRRVLSRAVVRALQEVLAPGRPFPPEPPTHLVLRGTGAGTLRASWRTAEGAQAYRVYVARDGRGFDSGTVAQGTSLDVTGGVPGQVVVVRVTSLNGGGESPASEAAGARLRPDGGPADVLVVNGFDRLDAWVREDRNHHDYAVEHGLAIAAADEGAWGFDGAANEAVLDGDVALAGYRVADWILGRESTEAETFSDAEQAMVASFLDGGGCLLATGTEVAWDLGATGSPSDAAFLADRLGAVFAEDDAGTRQVGAAASGPLAGVGPLAFDDGTGTTYDAAYPDVLEAAPGASAVLWYAGGALAGVAREAVPGRSMLLGFPLETVQDAVGRTRLMQAMLAF